jgi:colicin import membrane protein
MPAASDRLEFTPPPQPGLVRAFALAILAHILLMIALTWGIHWNREAENAAVEAELWSSVPQEAAPKLVQPPPPPPQAPTPEVKPPPPVVEPPKQPDIALEREKKKRELAERRREEEELQKKLEAQRKQEDLKRERLAEKKAAEEKRKLDEQEKLAKTKRLQQEDAKRLEALRQENLKRMQGLAGAAGAADAKGSAKTSSGPSDSYGSRIRARVRPNIVFTDDIPGNPVAEVEFQMAPEGTITSRRIVKSSGFKSWDEAVLRALDKTEVLPRDIDGRVHTPLIIEFKPKS